MNPRDFRTWRSLADHPIFSDARHDVEEWSTNPSLYDGIGPAAFDPEWYVHEDPKLPTEVQAAVAEHDVRNLSATCSAIWQRFGEFAHELFILDDFTVVVCMQHQQFTLEIYPQHYRDDNSILSVFLDSPVDAEFDVDSVDEVVPRLESLLDLNERVAERSAGAES